MPRHSTQPAFPCSKKGELADFWQFRSCGRQVGDEPALVASSLVGRRRAGNLLASKRGGQFDDTLPVLITIKSERTEG